MKDARYPYTLKSAISHVNAAAVLLELETEDETSSQRDANALALRCLEEVLYVLYKEHPGVREIIESIDFEQGFKGVSFAKQIAPCYVLLVQNCITILRMLGDYSSLSSQSDALLALGFLQEILTAKEREGLNLERRVLDMAILPIGDVTLELDDSLLEFNQVKEMEQRRRQLELEMRLEAERRAAEAMKEETSDEKLRRLRLEKEMARLRRREERRGQIKTRRRLYNMIKSDEITSLFKIKSKTVANNFGEDDPDVDDPFSEG
jgi:hypothetical protein